MTKQTGTPFKLDARDEKILSYVHPTLAKLVSQAAKTTEVPFTVFEGVRTLARQKKLKAKGASKTLRSRHLTGHAVDLVPLLPHPKTGKLVPTWDGPATRVISKAMFDAIDGAKLSGKIRWGGDWDRDGKWNDERFYDGPHFEMERKAYGDKPAKRTQTYLDNRGAAIPHSRLRTKVRSKYDGKVKTVWAASVQQAVNSFYEGTDAIPLVVDGHYGDATREAVREFQMALGITPVDGLWGPQTSRAYYKWRAEIEEAKQAEIGKRLEAKQAEFKAKEEPAPETPPRQEPEGQLELDGEQASALHSFNAEASARREADRQHWEPRTEGADFGEAPKEGRPIIGPALVATLFVVVAAVATKAFGVW
jgi:peptidoglycan L-alanyl-D-glutamate endopeptidase CwlK